MQKQILDPVQEPPDVRACNQALHTARRVVFNHHRIRLMCETTQNNKKTKTSMSMIGMRHETCTHWHRERTYTLSMSRT